MTQSTYFCEPTQMGILCISGEDAKKFLQGQLTCNVEEIYGKISRLGAHCNPQGRVISLFRLGYFQNDYWMILPRDLIPIAMTALKKYAVFFKKLTLTDMSDIFGYVSVGKEIQDLDQENFFVTQSLENPPRYEIIGPRASIKALKTNIETDFQKITIPQWISLNIAAGLPMIYPETSEKFLPHDLNLPQLNGVSFSKGCYTGQEIIARMHYKGNLKNHLYKARVESPFAPSHGLEIYNKTSSCGNVVEFAQMGYNLYDLLVITSEATMKTGDVFLDEPAKIKITFIK